MKKSKIWWLAPFVILFALVGLFWPLLFSGANSASQSSDPAIFDKFKAEFVIDNNGNAQVTQTIDANFPTSRHGLYEFFDIDDRSDKGVRYEPTIESVTRDGLPDQWVGDWSGNYYSLKIGSEGTILPPGNYTYQIKYSIPGVISPVTAGGDTTFNSNSGTAPTGNSPDKSSFYFNVIGQGWNVPIKQAEVNLQMPSAVTSIGCTAGTEPVGKMNGPCGINGLGTNNVTLTAQSIPANSGMTARATMDMAPPARAELPWAPPMDRVLGRTPATVGLVGLLSAIGLLVGFRWSRKSKEPYPGFPVMYEPPQGLGPVQTYYIDYEQVGSKAITATMFYMADQKLVKLEKRDDNSWLVTGLAAPEEWAKVDAGTQAFGQALGVTNPGYWFLAEKSEAAGQKLLAAQKAQKSAVELWGVDADLLKPSPYEQLGRFLFVVALIVAAFLFFFSGMPTMWGLPFAAFALGALGVMATGVGTRRTDDGRQVWSRAGGFERFLSTSSSEDRFDFSAKKDLFISYIPYAVMFGVADKWAAKYQAYTSEAPPEVPWFPYGYGMMYGTGAGLGGFGDSFESVLNSGISSYHSAQMNTGSTGGGFGGGGLGGGGGGGGGGSW